MSTINKSDILSAITLYTIANERQNCPISYLIEEKFGVRSKKLVTKLVNELKKDGVLVGKRGRTGGLCFPEVATVEATPVETTETVETQDNESEDVIEQDGMQIQEIPF